MILCSESSLSFFCCSITIANCCCNFSTSVLRKLSALSLSRCFFILFLFFQSIPLCFSSLHSFLLFQFSAFFRCFRCEDSSNTLAAYSFSSFSFSHCRRSSSFLRCASFLPILLPLSLQVSVFHLSPLVPSSLHAFVSLHPVSS